MSNDFLTIFLLSHRPSILYPSDSKSSRGSTKILKGSSRWGCTLESCNTVQLQLKTLEKSRTTWRILSVCTETKQRLYSGKTMQNIAENARYSTFKRWNYKVSQSAWSFPFCRSSWHFCAQYTWDGWVKMPLLLITFVETQNIVFTSVRFSIVKFYCANST